MPILNNIAAWLMKKRVHQIELFMKYPYDVQGEWLEKLLHTSCETEWGIKYGYSHIKNHEQFRNQVPLQTYETLLPYIDRIRGGEQGLLWPEEIKWFAKSAGTTGKGRKLIPISPSSLDGCHYNGGRDMVAIHCNNYPETKLFTGKNLALGGTQQKEYFRNYESWIGDVSAIVISNLPLWAEYFRAPDVEIALIKDWEEKLDKLARATMNENVTSVAGVPCWMLMLFKRILEYRNETDISAIWPNLEVYFHGGMNFSPYKKQFREIFQGLNVSHLQLYNATEGFFGIQFDKESDEMLLMLDYGIYYEFIPFDETDSSHPKTIHLSEVELFNSYEMVISTTAGLWRYRLGDVITFTSKVPYKFFISGRTKQCINTFGEKLMVQHAEESISICADTFNCSIVDFTAGANFHEKKHEWYIEIEKEGVDPEAFSIELDACLKEINLDYKLKRENNLILAKPSVCFVPKGSFYSWQKSKGKLGGQHKVIRLSNSLETITDLKQFLNGVANA